MLAFNQSSVPPPDKVLDKAETLRNVGAVTQLYPDRIIARTSF